MRALLELLAYMTLFGYAVSISQYTEFAEHDLNCPAGWRYFEFKCYKLSTTSSNYDDVREECLGEGADMPVLDSRQEMLFLENWQSPQQWVGMSKLDGDDFYTWVDGKVATETYSRWSTGEPDTSSNNAAIVNVNYLYDASKSDSYHTTCEKRANTADTLLGKFCASQTEVRAKAESLYLSSDLNPHRTDTACSQACLEQSYGYSARINGLCVCMRDKPADGTCDDITASHKVYYYQTTEVSTDDFDLDVTQPTDMACALPSHTYYDGSCYTYVTTSLNFSTHNDQAKALYGSDAQVVSINTAAEARFIDEVLLGDAVRVTDNTGERFYIGVVDVRDGDGNIENYANTDNVPLNEAYSRWAYGQGYDSSATSRCAYHNASDKFWYTIDCSSLEQAIIEYPASDSGFIARSGSKVDLYTPIEARMAHDGGPIPENSVDFGYEGQFDWDQPFESFTHFVRDIGKQEVLYESTDFWYQTVNGSTVYKGVLPSEASDVRCPLIVDTTYEMECEIGGTGETPLTATVDFGDGTTPDVLSLEGSTIEVVGPNIQRSSETADGVAIDGYSAIMYNSMIRSHGLIQAFEFDVVVPGEFKFVVWRPRCEALEVFCAMSMSCEALDYLNDVCENATHVTNIHSIDCGVGYKWSLARRACVDSSGNVKDAPRRDWSSFPAISYLDNIGDYETSAGRRGRHFVSLSRGEAIMVEPGDFVGFIGKSGRFAHRSKSDSWTPYSDAVSQTYFPESSTAHFNEEFFLNAYLTKMHRRVVPHMCPYVNNQTVSLSITNDYTSSDPTSATDMLVYELVTEVEIVDDVDDHEVGRSVIKGTELTTFRVNNHYGDPCWYYWDFGDGNAMTTRDRVVSHIYMESGRYNCTVIVSNELSWGFNWSPVLVQGEIKKGFYTQYDNSTRKGRQTVHKICIDDGNEVFFSLTVGDSTVHPKVTVFENDPVVCMEGFTELNTDVNGTMRCYQKTPTMESYDSANGTCSDLYYRAFLAKYEEEEHFSSVYSVWPTGDIRSGYRRYDLGSENRGWKEGEIWHDPFGVPFESFPLWGGWQGTPGTAVGDDCISHYSPNLFQQRDCSIARYGMCMYEGRCETFSVVIDEIGVYDVKLRAENRVSDVEHTFIQYIENPILDLYIHPIPSQTWGDTVVLFLNFTSGSNLTAVCYNSEDGTGDECGDFVFNEGADGMVGNGTITIPLTEYKIINDHYRYVKVTNKISDMVATRMFTVMYAIEDFELDSTHDCAITTEDRVEYTLTAKQMSHAHVTYSYNDQSSDPATSNDGLSSDVYVYIAEMTEENHPYYPAHQLVSGPKYFHNFSHHYPWEGTYTITLNASNDVSWNTISRTIVIENPIRGYKILRTTPVPIWPGQVATVTLNVVFDPELNPHIWNNPHRIPTDVTQWYKYGHPNCEALLDVDECLIDNGGCNQTCINTDGSFYCTCETNYYMDIDGWTCLWRNTTTNSSTTPEAGSTTTAGVPDAGIVTPGPDARMTTANMWDYNGKDCPEATHSEMVFVTETITDDDSYDYKHFGTFEISTFFNNCISSDGFTFTIDIDQPVINMTIESDNYILPWMDNTTLTMNMDWGSRINLTWDYNDTNPVTETVYDRLYPNFLSHVWDVEGDFYPTVTAVNLVGTWTAVCGPVYVQYILADALRVETPFIWAIPYPSYSKEIFFHVYLKQEYATMMPTNVTANVSFGELIAGTDEVHTLLGVYLPDAAQDDETKDKNGDKHVWTYSHHYTVGDTYNVTIDFINWVSSLSIDVEFHAMEEIAPLTLHVNYLPMDPEPTNEEGEIDWTHPVHEFVRCDLIRKEYPDDLCMDGIRKMLGLWNDSVPAIDMEGKVSYYKRIPTNDLLKPPINATNFLNAITGIDDLDREELEVLVADAPNIRSTLSGAQLAAFDLFVANMEANPPLTIAETEGLLDMAFIDEIWFHDWQVRQMWAHNAETVEEVARAGHILPGDNAFSYPLEHTVEMHLEFARGSHLHFRWYWGDGYDEVTVHPYANHRYENWGLYQVKVVGFNSVSQRIVEIPVNIQRSVTNVTLDGYQQVSRNMSWTYTVCLGSLGTDACYFTDFRDQGTDEFPTKNRFFFAGNKDVCRDYYSDQMDESPEFTPLTMQHLEDTQAETGEVCITHTFIFGTKGTVIVKTIGINRVSADLARLHVAITKGPCFSPMVLLNSMNPCDPVCNDNEKVYYKSDLIEMLTAIAYNCTTTKLADHVWQFYSVDSAGVETEMVLPNVTAISRYDETPIRIMYIPPLMLEYGKYKVTLNITMYDEFIWFMDTMYFHVAQTPLHVSINSPHKMIWFRWKWETNCSMDVASFTYDPDNPEDRDGFSFVWMCRRLCETFPVYDDDYNMIENMTDDCENQNKTYYTNSNGEKDRGCFFDDDRPQSGLFTDSTDGTVLLDLSQTYEFEVLELAVIVKQYNRTTIKRIYLEVTQGMPPEINPDLCVSNCKEKVNYESIFSLSAGINSRAEHSYRWSLYKGPRDDIADPYVMEVVRSEWEKNRPADKETMVSTGHVSQSFALEPGFYTADDTADYFFVSVIAWRGNSIDNFGIAILAFQVNEPPLPGNCTAYPANGTAIDTYFNVDCSEFVDEHKPVFYQTGTRPKGSEIINWGPERIFPKDPQGGLPLGQGDEEYNYEVEIFVRARDSIGAKTVSEPMSVRVLPKEIAYAAVDVNDMAAGDPIIAAQTMNSYLTTTKYEKKAVIETQDTTDMSEDELKEYEENIKLQKEKQAKKDAEVQAFNTKVSDSLKALDMTDVSGLLTINQAAEAVASNEEYVTAEALDNVKNIGKKGLNVLHKKKGSLNAEEITENAAIVVASQSKTQMAAAKLKKAEQADPVVAAENSRKRRETGVSSPDEIAASIQETLGEVAGFVGDRKVAGEGDTVIGTEKMKMVVMKQFASAFSGGKLAGAGDVNNGIALPSGEALLGVGNDSASSVSSQTNNYDTLPYAASTSNDTSAAADTSTSIEPTGQILQIVLKDENGMPLNNTNSNSTPAITHVFMSRDDPPPPIISRSTAARMGGAMLPHKIVLPKQSSIHVKMRRFYNLPNTTDNVNGTNATDLPGLLDGSATTLDPIDVAREENKTNMFFEDLGLMFVLYFREDTRPTFSNYDFSCTLPITYYNIDENTTVAIGGTMMAESCDAVLAENENATCETHTLNRDAYPPHKDIVDNDDMTCYIPNTWLDNYAEDVKMYVGVSYYFINTSAITGLENTTFLEFSRGLMPEFQTVEIPDEFYEPIYYEMEVSAASCKYWSPFYEDYVTDGCEVGPLTSPNLTHCMCGMLAPSVPPYDENDDSISLDEYERKVSLAQSTPGISFGSGVSVPFNTIDPSNSAFNNLGDNPLVFSIMVSVLCLYLCSLIWATAQDKKDAIKAGVSPLLDNDPRDRYLYEVTVYTGSRSGASTTAKVSIIFSGEEDETPPRLIYDDKRPILQSGGVDSFVMAAPRSLGSMSHIRVWHDNSGKSPGWFFSRMQVVDMQTLEKYFFILDRWLSAGEDDGIIDRIVPLAGKDELTGFSHLFFTKARKDLMDGHIWFSIFGKPHKSNFTRVQRLTCCLALLFASMAANIMFYQSPDEAQAAKSLRLGPISLTYTQILTGILSGLVAFPINLLIVIIFKNTKEPPYDLGKRCCSPCKKSKKKKRGTDRFAADELAQQAKILDGDMNQSRVSSFASLGGLSSEGDAIDDYVTEEAKKRNKKYKLPWGFLVVAYFLALCVTGGAFYYTIEAAGVFGPKKSAEWTGAFCTSILESIFMSQPIKVLGIALFWALVIKKPDADENVDPGLEKGEEYMHKHEKQCEKLDQQVRKRLNKYKNIPIPPSEEYLTAARAMRQKEVKMMEVLWEVFLYVLFLYLVSMVSFGNRDPSSHTLYNALYSEFHDAVYVPNNGVDMQMVTEYKSFWAYCERTLLPSLWPEPWYDGVARDPMFTADRNMYRIGVPRLRQLRMPSEQCEMPMYKYTKECNIEYSLFSEDTGNYYPGWIPVGNISEPGYEGPYPGWYWQSSSELDGFPFSGQEATYGGGGFNIELGYTFESAMENLQILKEHEWLTPETRAVLVEFVLYNPNLNTFTVSSITFEFLPTGSVVPDYKMNLIKLDRYIGTYMITVLVSEILTFLYFIYFTVREARLLKKLGKKYFESFWNCVEMVTLLLGLLALVMFFMRFALVKRTATDFRANPRSFVSFQFATTWEEIYSYILSFLIFISTVKFLKLLRFNKKMTMLGLTMMYIGKPLLSFLMALGIVFFAFAQMAYLVYCSLLLSFSTFIKASMTLFTLMLNKFDYKELEDANAVFAAIIFVSFTVLVSWVLLSFMITIILEGFTTVTEELKQKENQYEIVDFVVSKFKGAVGFGTGPSLPAMNKESSDAMISETHAELMDRFEDFEEMFRDFCMDEVRGDEPLVAKYEKEIMAAKKASKNRTIYATD